MLAESAIRATKLFLVAATTCLLLLTGIFYLLYNDIDYSSTEINNPKNDNNRGYGYSGYHRNLLNSNNEDPVGNAVAGVSSGDDSGSQEDDPDDGLSDTRLEANAMEVLRESAKQYKKVMLDYRAKDTELSQAEHRKEAIEHQLEKLHKEHESKSEFMKEQQAVKANLAESNAEQTQNQQDLIHNLEKEVQKLGDEIEKQKEKLQETKKRINSLHDDKKILYDQYKSLQKEYRSVKALLQSLRQDENDDVSVCLYDSDKVTSAQVEQSASDRRLLDDGDDNNTSTSESASENEVLTATRVGHGLYCDFDDEYTLTPGHHTHIFQISELSNAAYRNVLLYTIHCTCTCTFYLKNPFKYVHTILILCME